MKKFGILALVLACVMMFSVVSFAADSFKVTDTTKIPSGTTVTPAATEIAVSTGTANGNYYGILLVEGDDLPVVDNAILYIDQLTGDGSEKAVTVKPIMPEVGTPLTLYISSNTGADLISIPMVYSADAPAYTLGDVNGDKSINGNDVLALVQFVLNGTTFEAAEASADVNGDKVINGNDVLALVQYVLNGTAF